MIIQSKLRVTNDIVDCVGRLHRLARTIGRHDRDLSKQLQSAATSIGLNSGEGAWARAGNRTVRLESAINSAREALMALRIAGAAGYVGEELLAAEADTLDRIIATLWKLTYR